MEATTAIITVEPDAARPPRTFRKVSRLDRAFIVARAKEPDRDADDIAHEVGYRQTGTGYRLEKRLADLIAAERDRQFTARHMHLPEALAYIADMARDATLDPKIRLAAIRTVAIDIEGSLKQLPPEERVKLGRELEQLVAAMKAAAPGRTARASATITLESAPDKAGDE